MSLNMQNHTQDKQIGIGDSEDRIHRITPLKELGFCLLSVCAIYFSPTWQDSPWYQWGLHGYPENMNTMFRDVGIKIQQAILAGIAGVALYFLCRSLVKRIRLFSEVKQHIWSAKLTTQLALLGICLLYGIFVVTIRYQWNKPEHFDVDPFLFGFRERISLSFKSETVRGWLMESGYDLNNLSEHDDIDSLTIPSSIRQMFHLNESQMPWVNIQQHHVWIFIDGWDASRFGVVIGAKDSSPPQIWRCLPFQEGAWVIVEDLEYGENNLKKNACNKGI